MKKTNRLQTTTQKRNRLKKFLVSTSLVAVTALSSLGCHRAFYRKQADQEVQLLLQEKASHVARAPNTELDIAIDRRSRMFNPFDLDYQPMPLDDPASHRYMQCVDGRRAYPLWDGAGFTNTAENPDWWQFLPLNEDGVLVLDTDTAVRLALLHSTEYQEQLEQLYLSALDVSSERFRFDTQFFGNAGSTFDVLGRRNGGPSSRLGLNRDLTMTRQFATGGSLVAGIANNIVWDLSGPNTQSAGTLLDFSLVQPLLRGAGRDVVLERLTISERRLLANIRAFERFRRSFYLNITIGRGIESRVSRSGGIFGVGLGGFTGLGGGFAGLGGGGGGIGFTGGAAVPDAGGFVGLLQDQIQIKNLEENISRLSESLLVLEDTLIELLTTIPDDPETILRQRLQVAQQRSALLDAQSRLVGLRTAYQASIDRFLGDLGLPPYICTRIRDPLLDRFELIDGDLRSRRAELLDLRSIVGQLNISLLAESEQDTDPETGLPVGTLQWSDEVEAIVAQLREELGPLKEFLDLLQNDDSIRVVADIEELTEILPERLEQNKKLLEFYELERENICTLLEIDTIDESVFEVGELSTLKAELEDSYEKLMVRLASYEAEIEKIDRTLAVLLEQRGQGLSSIELADEMKENVILATQDLLSKLGDDVLAFQLIQARARTESALLPDVDITPAEAFEIARRNRRDYANARASLVDSWRLIEFNADNLESDLDLTFSGGIGGDGNSPWTLTHENASLRMGLQWDAPITRLQERNTYRQSLIEFEQAKRSYYQFEDGIWQLLRGQIRQLQTNRITFEYGRQSLRIAASQIELNEDIRELRDSRGLNSGPTAARDTISALSDLQNSQNTLLNVFVNYEVLRRNLQFDLGTMQLTPEGMWIDQGDINTDYLLSLPGTTVQGLPPTQCTDCNIPIRHQPQPPDYTGLLIDDAELIEVDSIEFQPMVQPPVVPEQPVPEQPVPEQPVIEVPVGEESPPL